MSQNAVIRRNYNQINLKACPKVLEMPTQYYFPLRNYHLIT